MDLEKILNLGLVFESDVKKKFETYSQYLSEKLPGPYILGINSLPHISVLQFTSDKPVEKIWDITRHLSNNLDIELKGLYFQQGRTTGKLWFGIRVKLSEQLLILQQDIMKKVRPNRIINGEGASYFPHITMGCSEIKGCDLPAICFEPNITMMEVVSCKLALGRSGPQLQFTEIIAG
jgi:hypothetical protein